MNSLYLKIAILFGLSVFVSEVHSIYQEIKNWSKRDHELSTAAEEWSQGINLIETINSWMERSNSICPVAVILNPPSARIIQASNQALALVQNTKWTWIQSQARIKRMKGYLKLDLAQQMPRRKDLCSPGKFVWSSSDIVHLEGKHAGIKIKNKDQVPQWFFSNQEVKRRL